jgi:hypothetical protein
METKNYTVMYSGVSRSTRAKASVMIWIHKSNKNTVINNIYWSERIIELKLNTGRGKLSFLNTTPHTKRKYKKTIIYITNYRKY